MCTFNCHNYNNVNLQNLVLMESSTVLLVTAVSLSVHVECMEMLPVLSAGEVWAFI